MLQELLVSNVVLWAVVIALTVVVLARVQLGAATGSVCW